MRLPPIGHHRLPQAGWVIFRRSHTCDAATLKLLPEPSGIGNMQERLAGAGLIGGALLIDRISTSA